MKFSAIKHSFLFEGWVPRALGLAAMLGVVAIAIGRDTNLLAKISFVDAAKAEQRLIGAFHSEKPAVLARSAATSQPALADEGPLPDLGGAIGWLNSAPLSGESLRGKVALVDIWTYTCINSLRPLPYVKNWVTKYKDAGLVVIGVHTPEFSFEKERVNVENAVRDLKITYPVAIDSNYSIWQAFNNSAWPAQYLIDGKGRIRYHHFGESEYEEIERIIQELLKENGATGLDGITATISADGVEAAPSGEETRNDCWQKSDRLSKIHRGSASDRPGREDFKAPQNYPPLLVSPRRETLPAPTNAAGAGGTYIEPPRALWDGLIRNARSRPK